MADLLFKKPSPFLVEPNKNKPSRVMQPNKTTNEQMDFNKIPMQMPSSPSNTGYSHRKEMAKLEDMNKNLLEIKEKLTKTSVQCHMLQVDLVSLYNPHSVQTLKKTKDVCNSCSKTIETTVCPMEA